MEQTQQPPSTPATVPSPEPPAEQPIPPPSSSSSSTAAAATATTTTSVASPPLNPTTTTTTTSAAVTTTSVAVAIVQQQTPLLPRQPFTRTWQQPSPFQHFSLPPPPPPPPPHSLSSSSVSASSSISVQNPRGSNSSSGGMAMGVPAHHHHHPTSSFSSLTSPSYGQEAVKIVSCRNVRGSLGVTDKVVSCDEEVMGSTYENSLLQKCEVRQPIQGMHGMGMIGSLGSTSPMRPAGVTPQQLRPVPSPLRPQTSIGSQSAATQNFPGHGMLRVQSVGFPSPQSHTTTSQSPRSQNQPWLSSGAPGKPPLPTPSLRPQTGPQSLHQRSQILSSHQHTVTTTSSAQQSQPSTSSLSQDHLGQQMPPSRIQQSLSNQPLARGQGLGIQRPSSHALMQSTAVQQGPPSKAATPTTVEMGDPCARILSKRSIQDIVTQVALQVFLALILEEASRKLPQKMFQLDRGLQGGNRTTANKIDPSEKLDAEVEDILVDIAEEFVESITTFGCSLAKHRKSNTLEAKDILLHLERNWNMTLPGFGGDEIRAYKKPFTSEIHKERIAAGKAAYNRPLWSGPSQDPSLSGSFSAPAFLRLFNNSSYIKKSALATEMANAKGSTQTGGTMKSHLAKNAANILGSPNAKT
ncbi:Transcription initiation factor TFIID subunit 12 [Capsicum annuum]|nr:Transcription initiation factor TFIID subunit 12 [Capsicum annuum]